MSFTIPLVRFPDRWSFFNTIKTNNPDFIFIRFVPLIIFLSYDKYQEQSSAWPVKSIPSQQGHEKSLRPLTLKLFVSGLISGKGKL